MIDLLASQVAHPVSALTVWATDPTPQPDDVKAGWTAFVIFLLLAAAVVVLGISLVKQLRKAQAAKDAGVYGDEKVTREEPPTPGSPAENPENNGRHS